MTDNTETRLSAADKREKIKDEMRALSEQMNKLQERLKGIDIPIGSALLAVGESPYAGNDKCHDCDLEVICNALHDNGKDVWEILKCFPKQREDGNNVSFKVVPYKGTIKSAGY